MDVGDFSDVSLDRSEDLEDEIEYFDTQATEEDNVSLEIEDAHGGGDAYPDFVGMNVVHHSVFEEADGAEEELDDDIVMKIPEECDKERCDFAASLWNVRGGRQIFHEIFGRSADDQRQKHEDVFMSNVHYARRLQKNDYKLDTAYSHSKRTPGQCRLYAKGQGRGCNGQQQLRRSVRKFLQTDVYYDYDMVCAWPSILWMLCEDHNIYCDRLRTFVQLCHDGKRDEFLLRNKTSKKHINVALNQDEPKFNRAQRKCGELMWLFYDLIGIKKSIFELYNADDPHSEIGGFRSNPDKPENPISTLVAAVLQDKENEILQRALKVTKDAFGKAEWGPLAFDGFQHKKLLDQRFIETRLDSKYVKWAMKPNRMDVDLEMLRSKVSEQKEKEWAWEVEAETYEHRDEEGVPRTRELVPADGFTNISLMLRDEMGMGKSHQLFILILRQFTMRNERWLRLMRKHKLTQETELDALIESIPQFPYLGEDVLIIYHRIALIGSMSVRYWEELEINLYSDVTGLIPDAGRWVVCIDSLWRFGGLTDYDLCAVDEFTACLKSMSRLEKKSASSGKWNVSDNLRRVLESSDHVVLMSAQADRIEKEYLDDIGLKMHWQMNSIPNLNHYTYTFAHYEDKNHEFEPLKEALDKGLKIAIPCSENKDLRNVLGLLQKWYPEKRFKAIYGAGMSDEERKRCIQEAEAEGYDALLYTSSMDCGVSIDIEWYDMIVFRLNSRSIDANTVMQMVLRVRKLNLNKVVFVCDKLVKDWEHLPGYEKPVLMSSKKLPKRCKPIITGPKTLGAVRQYVYNNNIKHDTFYWRNQRKNWYQFNLRVPPPEVTKEEVKQFILRPACIEETLKDVNYINESLTNILEHADTDTLRIALEATHAPSMPMVNLMVNHAHEAANQYRNLVANITRIAKLQGATVTHDIAKQTVVDEETQASRAEATKEQADAELQLQRDIMLAEDLSIDQLTQIKKKTNRCKAEQDSFQLFYMRATFGNAIINEARKEVGRDEAVKFWLKRKILRKDDGTVNTSKISDTVTAFLGITPAKQKITLSLTNKHAQKKFRKITALADEDAGFVSPQTIFGQERMAFEECIDSEGNHPKAVLLALCNLFKAFGFEGPCDAQVITITPEIEQEIRAKLEDYYKVAKPTTKSIPKGVVKTANQILKDKWGIGPTIIKRNSSDYRIGRTEAAERWGPITHQRYEHYKAQVAKLEPEASLDDFVCKDFFEAMMNPNKKLRKQTCKPRKRTRNDDGTEDENAAKQHRTYTSCEKEHVEALEQQAKDSIIDFIQAVCQPGNYLNVDSMVVDYLTKRNGLVPTLKSDGDDKHRIDLNRLVLKGDTAGIIELCSARLSQLA